MSTYKINKAEKIHFVGIGGIGVSAIARMMLHEGKSVTGSDIYPSKITKELESLGAKIFYSHCSGNVGDVDLVVYSPAVNEENVELIVARSRKIVLRSYPEILGEISKNKFTIAISGAHGKTTTTAIIGTILKDASLEPTIIVGSLLKGIQSNFVSGSGEYFIVEACEYKQSFLNINPKIIVITNIDNDHLDYYRNVENIQRAFSAFIAKLDANGFLVCNPNGRYIAEVIKNAKCRIIDYTKLPWDFSLKLVGDHNLSNAQAAFAVAKLLDVPENIIRKSLENFSGTWRRFECKGKTEKGALVYDDYAHHPTEVRVTLAGARKYFGKRKIFCIFQPHLFSRTKILLNDFSGSFGEANKVIIAPIYAAREKNDKSINSKVLVEKIKQKGVSVLFLENFEEIIDYLKINTSKGDLIITMGAGDIYKIGERLIF